MTPAPPSNPLSSLRRWTLVVIGLLALTSVLTRVTVPWRLGITNDEAHHHLESWRNRYRTEDQNPMFLRKLEQFQRLGPERIETIKEIYHSSALAQRATFVLIDPQPPLFPVLAETIESLTHSSLVAQRIPSLLASLLTVWFLYCIGVRWKGRSTGLWMATLMAISSFAQYYAGIARPYAIGQCAVSFVVWIYLREQQNRPESPWRLLLAALIAQSAQWMLWPMVGILVLADLTRRWNSGARFWVLLRQTWWYALLSLALLVEMRIQLMNPVISDQAHSPGIAQLIEQVAVASPFGALQQFGTSGLWLAGIPYFALMAWGLVTLWQQRSQRPLVSGALALAFVATWITPALLGSSLRFMMIYSTLMILVAGIGVANLCRNEGTGLKWMATLLLSFAALGIWQQRDLPDADWIFPTTRYQDAAEDLETALSPGDLWLAYPYFNSNPLYRYARLPRPGMPLNPGQLRDALQSRPADRACFVLIHKIYRDLAEKELADASLVGDYGHIVLLRLPPRG